MQVATIIAPMTTTRSVHTAITAALALATLTPAGVAHAETYEIREGDDLWARLRNLAAGDEVIVHAGTYAQTSRWEATWPGTAAMPIVVRAAEGEARPVLTRDENQNLMNLHGTHFTFRGFELTGGSHGIRMSAVEDAVFEDLVIHGTGDVGISCNVTGMNCTRVTIRETEIYDTHGTGEGLYLGCNSGVCSFSESIIERNYIHDLGGTQGDGIEIKQGSWSNIIRDNVVVRSLYPGITLYSYTPAAGRTPNVIERNLIWTTRDNGIQVTGRAIIRNNIVIGAEASGIASQANMDMPTEVQILFNTVVGAGDACVRGNAWDTGTGFVVANNALYCAGARAVRLSGSSAVVVGNVGMGSVEGTSSGVNTTGTSLAADLGPMTAMARVYPPAGSALLDAADGAHSVSDDFDLRPRTGTLDVGAYERDASGMPAWLAEAGFKGFGTVGPSGDAGPLVLDAGVPPDTDAGPLPDAFVPPGTDAAFGNADATVNTADAGAGVSGGSDCGCRAGRSTPSSLAASALASLLLALGMRRRRAG